jgi:glycosyltransferase involved in cell wall biosynthesis
MSTLDGDRPLVSVIIPTYNGADFLKSAVDSVLGQTYPLIECIVVDDGSTDATPAIIESFGTRIQSERQANQGFARARNNGARLARGELLSFLDHDDWWRPDKVERQVRRLRERPTAAVVYTAVDCIDDQGHHLGTIPAPPQEVAFQNTILMVSPHLALEQGALIRREAFFALGAFDERLTTSIGCDLACRLALDYEVAGIDEPLVAYRQHSGQMHHDLSALEHDMRMIYDKVHDRDERYRPLLRRARYNLDICLAHWYWREQRRPLRAFLHASRATLCRPGYVAERFAGRRSEPVSSLRLPSKRS